MSSSCTMGLKVEFPQNWITTAIAGCYPTMQYRAMHRRFYCDLRISADIQAALGNTRGSVAGTQVNMPVIGDG